jgi:hypothetical protein
LAIGEVGDKTGGDRPREHCISKPKTYLLMYVPSVDWKSACWLYLFFLTHHTSSEEKTTTSIHMSFINDTFIIK